MSRTIIASSDGKILRRRLKVDGTPENVPMYPYEINSRLSELSLLDFSAQVLAGATLHDLALADVLKRIGLAERTGRGIDRIFEGSIVYGRPLPDYSESTKTCVKLYREQSRIWHLPE